MIAAAMPDEMLKRAVENGVYDDLGGVVKQKPSIGKMEIRRFSSGAKLDFFFFLFFGLQGSYNTRRCLQR